MNNQNIRTTEWSRLHRLFLPLAIIILTVAGFLTLAETASMQSLRERAGKISSPTVNYIISGNVQADGENFSGASVSLSGSQSAAVSTGVDGNYSFTVPAGGNYTISVYKNGFKFDPAKQIFNNLQSNQTANFQNGTPLCAPASSGLTAWYKGDGNTSDYTGNGNNGALDGGTTFAAGKVGQAFSFDGVDDRVAIPDAPSNSPSSALTLDAWIKPARINQQQIFISKYNNATSQDAFTLNSDATGNKLEFRVYQTGDSGGSYRIIQTTASVLSVNIWTHIAATFDTTTQAMKIYVNGVDMPTTVIETNGTITSIFNSVEPVRLGDFVNGAGNHVLFFQGLIDEAQIYNRALSQAEIQNIYNSGSAGVCLVSSFTGGGSLDPTFNGTGKVVTPFANGNDVGRSTVVQPDGKIIVVGSASNGSNLDFAIARYNADGSLDTAFGTNGKATTPIGGSDDEAFSAAIQTDDKIVVSGYSIGADANFAVVRYNSNGSLDTSFGAGGKVTTAASSGDDYAEGVVLQNDGKIVAGGLGKFGSNDDFLVVRYNTDGSLDTSFGTNANGIVHTAIGSSYDDADSVAIQPDGKIILAGYAAFGSQYDFGVVRYNTNGTLDTSFGSGGVVSTGFGGSDDFADSVAVQTDGKIVVAGDTYNGSNRDFAIARYNTNGSLDTTFGTGGKVITPIGNGLDIARSVKIQTDGKIVAAGVSNNGTNDDFAVVRYTANGSLDTNFGSGGKVTTAIGSGNETANSVTLQTDGKIVVAGFSSNGSNTDFAVVRYTISGSVALQDAVFTNGIGSLDNSFGTGGKVTTPIGSSNDIIQSVVVQSDGKIVAVGYSNNGANDDFALARYNPDGSLDNSFGASGKVVTPIGSSSERAFSAAIQVDGKIVAAGYTNGATADIALVRYNSDGSLDTSFGSGGTVITSIGTSTDIAYSIIIQADGKLVAVGWTSTSGAGQVAAVRYNSDGSLDSSFGIGGKAIVPNNGFNDYNYAYSAAIQTDGKIIAAGIRSSSKADFLLVRFNADGSIDNSFGTNGKVITTFGSFNDGLQSVVIQPDGKIIAAGQSVTNSSSYFALSRYNADGSLDLTFGTGGKILTPVGDSFTAAYAVALQTNGKILATGYSYNGSDYDFATLRYNINGSLDTSFGTDGKAITPFGISEDVAQSIVIQENGKIIAAGYSGTSSNHDFALARYNTNGGSVGITPVNNVNLAFNNVSQTGYTVATPLTTNQLPALPTGYSLPANAPMYDIRTSAGYSGNITVTFNVSNVASSTICNNLRVLHFENGAWTTATNGTPVYNSATQVCTVSQTVTSLSPFVVAQVSAPTAANISVSGRVLTADGRGIRNVIITLRDANGAVRSSRTGSFGYYLFDDVPTGSAVVQVAAKKYRFDNLSQIVNLTDNLTTVDFIARE